MAVLVISGCIGGISPEEIAKMTEEVQSFLDDYPNAEVTASYLDEEYVESIITELRGMCGEQMKIQPYWRVVFKDTDTDINITVWMEGENRNTVCFHKEGKEPEEPEEPETPVDDTVAKKVIDYLNDNIVPPGTLASLVSVEEESGIYVIKTLYGGNELTVYATKNGNLLIVGTVYDIGGEYETPPTDRNDIGTVVVEYLNDNIIPPGYSCSLSSIESANGIYTVKTLYNGNIIPVYATNDGMLLLIGTLYDMAGDSEPPEQPPGQEEPETSEKCDEVPKAAKAKMETWLVSMCPFAAQAMKGMYYVAKLFDDKADVDVRFITSIDSQGNPLSMHGEAEKTENQRQICLREEQPGIFWDYIHCYAETGDPDTCETSVGVDSDALDDCFDNRGSGYLLSEAADWMNIYQPAGGRGSPTFFVNGMRVSEYEFDSSGRSSNNIKNILCCGMITELEECFYELDKTNPPRGFGSYSSCSDAGILIRGAVYGIHGKGPLSLQLTNTGTVDMEGFSVKIVYQNGSVDYENLHNLEMVGQEIKNIFIEADHTLEEISIRSLECPLVQDFITRQHVKGYRMGGQSCTNDLECNPNYCVQDVCKSVPYYCGDDNCDETEDCHDCPEDCGECKIELSITQRSIYVNDNVTNDTKKVDYTEDG
ncbi:DsbA family protein, partial [Candidatus Aenigmatarchaeota archaeon]